MTLEIICLNPLMSGHCCNVYKDAYTNGVIKNVSIPLCRVIVVMEYAPQDKELHNCLNPLMSGHCCNHIHGRKNSKNFLSQSPYVGSLL